MKRYSTTLETIIAFFLLITAVVLFVRAKYYADLEKESKESRVLITQEKE